MGRSRRNKARLTREEWQQQMQDFDRLDEEQMRNRQQRSSSNAAPSEESAAPKVSDTIKSQEDTTKIESLDSKYSLSQRSKQSSESNRAQERALPSSRHDDIGSRNKNRSKLRMQFSSDEKSGEESREVSTPKRRYKRNNHSSPFNRGSDEESPLKKRYSNNKEPKDHSMSDKRYRRNRESSSRYKADDDEVSSIESWKERSSTRKKTASKKKKDRMSFPRRLSSSSTSSIDSPSPPRDMRRKRDETRKNRQDNTKCDDDATDREKVSSPSQSIAMPPQETAPLNVENNIESDSDASWDLMAIKRKNDMAVNHRTKQQTKKGEQSGKSCLESKKNRKRRNLSDSFSDDDQDQNDQDDSVHHRRRETRKRHTMDDEHTDSYSVEQRPKRANGSSQSRRKRSSRKAESSGDEQSVVDNSDDDNRQTSLSIRQHRDTESTNLAAAKHDELYSTPVEAITKPSSASFADDDDDGFMSDCDPVPSPAATKKSAKGNDGSKNRRKGAISKGQRKEAGKGEHFQQESVYDDVDIQYEVGRGGSPNDLHPYFENPKFGPYEPMEPLALSSDKDGPSVQVPASLNRYLAPFQKEGIRFMYDCLARESGVIMGDEMVRSFFYRCVFFPDQ